jgi:hypothetical protein
MSPVPTNSALMLRHLAAGEGVTTPWLVAKLGQWPSRQTITTAGHQLRQHEAAGRTVITGKRSYSFVWEITPAGREWLARKEAAWRAERETLVVRTAVRRWRAVMVEQARAGLPLVLDRAERRRLAWSLRRQGLTLDDIGRVFGVTREGARKILTPHVDKIPEMA